MAEKKRMTVAIDADIAEAVAEMAKGMRLSKSALLAVLIEAAFRTQGDSLAMIAKTLDGLMERGANPYAAE